MDVFRQKPPTPWQLILFFFVISISVLFIGILYYNNQKKDLLNDKQSELSGISDLKIIQITQWRFERIGDGQFLGGNILVVRKFLEFFKHPNDKLLKDDIIHSLKSLTDNFDYVNIFVLDPLGNVRLAFPNQDASEGDHLKQFLSDIVSDNKVVLTDLHRSGFKGSVHMDLIVPLVDPDKSVTKVLGYISLMVDPQKVLYPLLQSWPAPSKSAETLLLRIDGDEIIYLNELRHLKNTELTLKKPLITEKLPAAMAIQGITGTTFSIIKANLSFCKIIGYVEEELNSFTYKNFTHPDHLTGDEISLLRLIGGEIPIYKTEKRYINKNGSIIWGSTTVSIIRNDKGEVLFFLVMVEDITSKKKTEAELEKSFSLVKATLESTEDGILVVDLSGKIIQYNKKFVEMCRIPQRILDSGEDIEALGFVKDQLNDPDSFLENVRYLYAEPEATTSDLLEFKDGRFFGRYSQPQRINGIGVGRVWSFRDITERKRVEAALIDAKEKAEESDRLKTAFLHNVSHEIRTPMNAIIGFASLLHETGLSEPDRHLYPDIIFQSSNQLLSIINDIVDIANVETGQVKINLKGMNLNSSLKRLSEQFRFNEKENQVPIYFSLGLPDEKAMIITDSTKLIQILSNLISNSIKFTQNGQIDFGYILKEGFLELFVKDTGIGIHSDHQGKIFDRFYQVDRTVSRQYGGTGLGLSICKAYVELLGGKINIESGPGKGTLFVFTIPYIPA